jgi:hypothetical protein
MKKVIIFSLLFILSACSYDSSHIKTIVSQVKIDGVEHLKKELKLLRNNDQEQSTREEVKNIPRIKEYKNKEIGFSFSYPDNIVVGKEAQKGDLVLKIETNNIEKSNIPSLSRDDLLIMSKNLEKGEFADISGWTLDNSKKIYKIGQKTVEEGVVFSKSDFCSVVFERNLAFFVDNYLVNIILIASRDDITPENPDFFRKDEKNCANIKVWDFARQGEFYNNLLENELSGTAQEWFNVFEKIKESLKIDKSPEKTGRKQSVNIKQVYLSPEESGLNLIWPEISGVEEDVYKKMAKYLSFFDNTGKTLAQIEKEYNNCHCGLVGSSYAINYNKNNVLSISLFLSYKDYNQGREQEERINYVFNLKTGEKLSIEDLIPKEKINNLVKIANIKLQKNISKVSKNKDLKINLQGDFSEKDFANFLLLDNGFQFFYDFFENDKNLRQYSYLFISFDELEEGSLLYDLK